MNWIERSAWIIFQRIYHLTQLASERWNGRVAVAHTDIVGNLDILLAIPNLRGIQWIPGAGQPPADEWLDVLKRIRTAGKLCQVYVSRQGALDISRALGWQGFCFAIMEDENLTTQEASDFMKELE